MAHICQSVNSDISCILSFLFVSFYIILNVCYGSEIAYYSHPLVIYRWGWLAFNCGSTYGISGGKWKLAARYVHYVLVNDLFQHQILQV